MMAGRVCQEVYKLCVFTEILIVCFGQSTHMRNIALNKRCDISSQYVGKTKIRTGDCSAAINGNTNTVLDLNINPPNCIVTEIKDPSPFWWVDLGQEVAISVITIYGRDQYLHRMRCVNVSLDGNVVKRFVNKFGWSNNKYSITVLRSGQVVNITKDCYPNETMNFCEVQVWVCDDGWYGDNCTQACGRCAGGAVCDKVDGNCTSCETGFQLPRCDGNVVCLASSDKDKETVSLVFPVAGAAVGCSVVSFIIGVVAGWWLRKFRIKHPSSLRSSDDTSMTHELGTSVSIPRPEEKPDISPSADTSDYSNINVYEALKGGDDDTTSPYTNLSLLPTRG